VVPILNSKPSLLHSHVPSLAQSGPSVFKGWSLQQLSSTDWSLFHSVVIGWSLYHLWSAGWSLYVPTNSPVRSLYHLSIPREAGHYTTLQVVPCTVGPHRCKIMVKNNHKDHKYTSFTFQRNTETNQHEKIPLLLFFLFQSMTIPFQYAQYMTPPQHEMQGTYMAQCCRHVIMRP
jgi:hypothetical protein